MGTCRNREIASGFISAGSEPRHVDLWSLPFLLAELVVHCFSALPLFYWSCDALLLFVGNTRVSLVALRIFKEACDENVRQTDLWARTMRILILSRV